MVVSVFVVSVTVVVVDVPVVVVVNVVVVAVAELVVADVVVVVVSVTVVVVVVHPLSYDKSVPSQAAHCVSEVGVAAAFTYCPATHFVIRKKHSRFDKKI